MKNIICNDIDKDFEKNIKKYKIIVAMNQYLLLMIFTKILRETLRNIKLYSL